MKKFFDQISQKITEIQKNKKKIQESTPAPIIKRPVQKEEEAMKVELTVSTTTLLKILLIIVLFLAGTEVIIQLKTILITTLICVLLTLGVSPFLDNLERQKIPRPVAILILYLIFFGIMAIVFVKVIPIVAEQLLGIARDLQTFILTNEIKLPMLGKLGISLESGEFQQLLANNLTDLSNNLKGVAGSTFSIVGEIFQGIFNFIFALVLLFFLLLEREKIGNFLVAFFPTKEQEYIIAMSNSVKQKMAKWFRGQFTLMVIVGVAMYIGMKIFEFSFGMKYAATIGIFAGLVELFPYIGVLLSTSLAGIIALNVSPEALIAVLIWMASVQLIEGNFLIPIVMERAIGLSSTVVLIVLSIGATLGFAAGGIMTGLLGMIFSVPIAASVSIFIEDYAHRSNRKK